MVRDFFFFNEVSFVVEVTTVIWCYLSLQKLKR